MDTQTKISTLADLESALDSGRLRARMTHGNWWPVRRNGATQRWKRSPSRFRIPIKAGLVQYGALTDADLPLDEGNWRVEDDR